ncbi:MAG: peptide chain release factor N(5)-glutamine methyltransferase [Cryomorphaceae bacterium]
MNIEAQDKKRLLLHVLQMSPEDYARQAPVTLTSSQQTAYEALLQRRANGEPVSKMTGVRAFWKHEFYTTYNTLDPRPETEGIIEAVLSSLPDTQLPLHILDCGTGTGCIILSLLHEYPQATGTALDISPQAIAVAQRNAKQLNMTSRLEFLTLDWTNASFCLYDLIVSNPPYIPTQQVAQLMPDVKEYEPHCALDGGGDGLEAYRQLFQKVVPALKRYGLFICETGEGQSGDVMKLGVAHGLRYMRTYDDIAAIPRILVFQQP